MEEEANKANSQELRKDARRLASEILEFKGSGKRPKPSSWTFLNGMTKAQAEIMMKDFQPPRSRHTSNVKPFNNWLLKTFIETATMPDENDTSRCANYMRRILAPTEFGSSSMESKYGNVGDKVKTKSATTGSSNANSPTSQSRQTIDESATTKSATTEKALTIDERAKAVEENLALARAEEKQLIISKTELMDQIQKVELEAMQKQIEQGKAELERLDKEIANLRKSAVSPVVQNAD